MNDLKTLKMVPLGTRGLRSEEFVCELTDFLNEHMEWVGERRFGNYCMQFDDRHIAIRYPGATRGDIEVDENNVIVNIQLYNMTGGVAHGGKIYKDKTDDEILKFVGYKVEWPSDNENWNMKDCPICKQKINPAFIQGSFTGRWEFTHICDDVDSIIRVNGDTVDEVICKWNAVVASIENREK